MATQTLLLSKRIIPRPTMMLSLLKSQPVVESIIRDQVLSTHNYDDKHFNTNFILSIAENILCLGMGNTEEALVKELNQVEELINNYEQFPYHIIRQLSFMISSGLNANAANLHSTTINVLSMLSQYSWEDKLVIMLAAFSIIFGEFSVVSRKLGLCRKLVSLTTPPFDDQKVVVDCISLVLQLTKCVVELKQWQSYSPPQSAILALPMATYWIATTLVYASGCGAHFKVDRNELGELAALISKILAIFSQELAKKKEEESFQALQHAFQYNSSNRGEVLKLMFKAKDDDEWIFRKTGIGFWKHDRTVLLLITSGFDISNERIDFLYWLTENSVWLYIFWIPITQNSTWTIEDEQQFERLKERMDALLWWLNDPPKRLLPQFTRFVKEKLFLEWGEEPILVSIDQWGRIVHSNVMHMMLTWTPRYIEENTIRVQRLYNLTPLVEKEVKEGTSGVNRVVPEIDEMISDFLQDIDDKINAWTHLVENRIQQVIDQSTPYHSEREKDLWEKETAWSLHLLAPQLSGPFNAIGGYNAIGELINDWIQEEKYIFLFGGNDIKWVKKFTYKVREISSKAQLNLELVYVGRNKKIRGIIDKERMSHCPLYNSANVWWFWTRLQSMFLSRIRYLDVTKCPVKEYNNDEILQGLKKLLAYEHKNTTIEGWVLLSKGSKVIVCGHGTKMLQVMNNYRIWKENIALRSFGQAFKDHHDMLSFNCHSCCTVEYPVILNKIPENEKCPECSCYMHKFLTFTCCHGQDVYSDKDESPIE